MREQRVALARFLGLSALIVLAGCGSASSLRAQAVAAGDAVNLRASDVPGLLGGHVRPRPRKVGPLGSPTERCDGGVSGGKGVVGVPSRSFSRGGPGRSAGGAALETVHSSVFVFGSEAAAMHELAVLGSARARSCIEREMVAAPALSELSGKIVAGPQPFFRHVEVLTPASLPVSHAYGLRASGDVSFFAPGPARRYYMDSLGFALGRAVVVLAADGDPHPFPAMLERRLLALLYSRARADHL